MKLIDIKKEYHPIVFLPYLQLVLNYTPVQEPLKSIKKLKSAYDGGAVIKSKRDKRGQAAVQLFYLLLELNVVRLKGKIEYQEQRCDINAS